jgi:Zn-finger nucleic acid-binding protein
MANCSNCGAPLPLKSTVCMYCSSLNDVDLRRKLVVVASGQQMNRICPRCNCKLLTIDLSGNETFLIERCEKCFGLFFDLGELEDYLSLADPKTPEINHHSLNTLINENYHKDYPVGYLSCPVCKELMNRVNYGKKSGVVVNKCSLHGIWLDSGFLNHLIGWTKAGGSELDKIQKEDNKTKKLEAQKKNTDKFKMDAGVYSTGNEISLIDFAKMVKAFFTQVV